MYTRTNVLFEGDDKIKLRGWFYTPSAVEKPLPCIIMTHGFSALKEHDLDQFAQSFAALGKCVLIYDNRNFGESDGQPRLEVNPTAQNKDLQRAISYIETLPATVVDAKKIGLWGTSFSAGVHLVVAAIDKRVKCVVAQVPFLRGHHQFLTAAQYEHVQKKYQQDQDAQAGGEKPVMMKVAGEHEKDKAIIKSNAAFPYFSRVSSWQNQVTLRSLQYTGDFEPLAYVEKISPTPVLFIVAENDSVNATNFALEAYERAKDPKKLVMLAGADHFDPYGKYFTRCVDSANEWFDTYLG